MTDVCSRTELLYIKSELILLFTKGQKVLTAYEHFDQTTKNRLISHPTINMKSWKNTYRNQNVFSSHKCIFLPYIFVQFNVFRDSIPVFAVPSIGNARFLTSLLLVTFPFSCLVACKLQASSPCVKQDFNSQYM